MLKHRGLLIPNPGPRSRGQSFLELALVLPILLLLLMGLVEIAIYIGRYMDALDLTREAARFASIRDPFTTSAKDHDCGNPNAFDFWWDTSCIFAPPDPVMCTPPVDVSAQTAIPGDMLFWCNGLNKYLDFNPATDDVVISAYTIDNANQISQTHPVGPEFVTDANGETSYYWALSNHIQNGAYQQVDNWKKDCKGNVDDTRLPYFTKATVAEKMGFNASDFPGYVTATPAPGSKGFVAVEIFYCHHQTLSLPVFTIFVPNPLMIHAYTIMPLPQAAPTATPRH